MSTGAFGQPVPPGPPRVGWTGQGVSQHVSGEQRQTREVLMDREVARAVRQGEHYWLAIASFRLGPDAVRTVLGEREGSPHLDTENLRDVSVGCFVCEQAATPANVGARCPGEPR